MQKKSMFFLLVLSLAASLTPLQADGFTLPYEMPHHRLQQAADASHKYIDISYGTLIPILPYIGEIARAQALTVTNPTLLRILHAIELIADSVDVGSSFGYALTNRRDHGKKPGPGDDQPNLWSRLFSGYFAYQHIDDVKTAAQLTRHAGDLARFKQGLPKSSKKYLRDTRNKRMKELFGKRLLILIAARVLTLLITQCIAKRTTGNSVARNDQFIFRLLIDAGYRYFKVKHHGHGIEDDLLKRMHRYNRTHKKD